MKKILISILLSFSFLFVSINSIQANEFYYDEIIEVVDSIETVRATQTKTAKKTAYIKNSSGAVLWSVTVTGTFSYNGTTSTCTSSSVSTSVSNSYWSIVSKSSSKSGNKASAKATAKNSINGDTIATMTKEVTLTCSPTGALS